MKNEISKKKIQKSVNALWNVEHLPIMFGNVPGEPVTVSLMMHPP
jgi:hypothetical protein